MAWDYSGPPDYKKEYQRVVKENEILRQRLIEALAAQEYLSWQFLNTQIAPQNGSHED